jgi:hypothetical protein
MWGVTTLRVIQYKEYRHSTINGSRKEKQNRKYVLEVEVKFEKPSDTKWRASKKPIPKKSQEKISLDCFFKKSW